MSKKYLMGVDVGTQSAKVIIFDTDGHIICEGRKALRRLEIPRPLWAEHPDDDLWDSLKEAFRQVTNRFKHEFKGDLNDILAMGVCVIRCCRVLLQENGELAYPVINWMDKRLNDPYEYDPAFGSVRYVTTTSGYITKRLTGECKDTCANYIGWWPIDNDTWSWSEDPEIFQQCKTPRHMLFDLVQPGEILGYITDQVASSIGVPAGMPVVATADDKAVEALGSGSLSQDTALISLGTYIGAMVHGFENIKTAKNFWPFQASIPQRYLYECMGVRRGMWTISWFCDQFGPGMIQEAEASALSVEDFFNREAERVPAGSEGLLTIHDWAPPKEATYRKGVMFGFDGRHTRAHMYRSLMEGIAFTMKNHMDKMFSELKMDLKKLIISGGGANSDVFMQIFSDVFGVPVIRNQMNGSAAIGCAINAGMAMGVFDSYEEAMNKMVRLGDSFSPNLDHKRLYDQLNERVYKKAHEHFDPLLREQSLIVDH